MAGGLELPAPVHAGPAERAGPEAGAGAKAPGSGEPGAGGSLLGTAGKRYTPGGVEKGDPEVQEVAGCKQRAVGQELGAELSLFVLCWPSEPPGCSGPIREVLQCGLVGRAIAGGQGTEFHFLPPSSLLQMAATIDMNFQSDLLSIFEENLF